ncbi:MAG: autotransporter outer membrane beta-barrel domain-containing protein, partial [Terriglobales bacterium]
GVAVLCGITWAQAPATPPAPEQAPVESPAPIPTTPTSNVPPAITYPRVEFFVGGSYAEAGLFNAGHWAGLPGWDSSLGLNMTDWIGLVVDGGQYFGTSKIPAGSPAPFPSGQFYEPSPSPTFNVATREYNLLFGLQFARRKYQHWTPIAELMYGHQGTRGVATPVIPGPQVSEVSSGRALVAGGGLDYKISQRFALRLKADYLQTGSFKQKQDNVRFSVGVVIRNVHKKKRRLEDEGDTEP